MRQFLFVDFDDVLVQTSDIRNEFFETWSLTSKLDIPNGDTHFCKTDMYEWATQKGGGDQEITKIKFYNLFTKLFLLDKNWQKDIVPLEGAQDALAILKHEFEEIHVVASRDLRSKPIVEWMLEKFFPGCVDEVHCVHMYEKDSYHAFPRKDYIKDQLLLKFNSTIIAGWLESVLFIGDRPCEIADVLPNCPGLLLGNLYDHEYANPVPSVPNWNRCVVSILSGEAWKIQELNLKEGEV